MSGRRWPKYIVPEGTAPSPPRQTIPLFDLPAGCARCGGSLSGGGYCLACRPALCGGCGERSCPVCRGESGSPPEARDGLP